MFVVPCVVDNIGAADSRPYDIIMRLCAKLKFVFIL